MLRPMALARMTSIAALYGNPAADLDKGSDAVHKCYERAMSYLPYLQAEVSSPVSSIEDERNKAIERFRQWKKKPEAEVK